MISDAELSNIFEGKNCVVTGGSGLIGRSVTRLLCDYGAQVTSASLDSLRVDVRAKSVKVDLRDFESCMRLLDGADYVFHLAGIKGSMEVTKSNPATFMVPMLQFNTNVLEAARLKKIKNLVFTSSIGAYQAAECFVESDIFTGDPMDTFPGWAKRIAELQIKAYRVQYGLEWGVVRPCNVYGPGDNFDPDNAMVIPSLMMRIKSGEAPLKVWGDGTAVRDFCFSDDAAVGIILACIHGTRGSYVNIGSGVGITVSKLVEHLSDITGCDYFFDTKLSGGFPRRVMDISRARDWLGYEPRVGLKEGLTKTWNWFNKNQSEFKLRKNYFSEGNE